MSLKNITVLIKAKKHSCHSNVIIKLIKWQNQMRWKKEQKKMNLERK